MNTGNEKLIDGYNPYEKAPCENDADYFKYSYEWSKDCNDNKYAWLANDFFDMITYDGDLDEKFGRAIIEVIEVIFNKTNFEYFGEYLQNVENYEKYILVANLIEHWLEWGTSIRGAWFSYYDEVKLAYIDHEFELTEEFVKSLIDFVKE